MNVLKNFTPNLNVILGHIPVTYVVDAEGVVRDKFIATPNKLLHDAVIPLLPH
jgi:hypothetical protein